jgi:hypothetical protein
MYMLTGMAAKTVGITTLNASPQKAIALLYFV